jgi:DNA-binding NarL/FixJ family response regulator
MDKKIRVIYAEKVDLCRNTFPSIFESQAPHIEFVGTASTYSELSDLIKKIPFDVLMLGKLYDTQNDIEILSKVRRIVADKPIIHYRFRQTTEMLKGSLEYANAQLSHVADVPVVIEAIEKVYAGENYFCI